MGVTEGGRYRLSQICSPHSAELPPPAAAARAGGGPQGACGADTWPHMVPASAASDDKEHSQASPSLLCGAPCGTCAAPGTHMPPQEAPCNGVNYLPHHVQWLGLCQMWWGPPPPASVTARGGKGSWLCCMGLSLEACECWELHMHHGEPHMIEVGRLGYTSCHHLQHWSELCTIGWQCLCGP